MCDPAIPARKYSIPLFAGNLSHPSVPLAGRQAIARSAGQGRPQAGARALPLTEASTMAGWLQRGGGSWLASTLAIITAIALAAGSPAATAAENRPSGHLASSHPHAAHIAEASQRFRIPALWISAVLDAESAGHSRAVSSAGAMGLMQVMPDTWAELRARHRLGTDPFDLRDNIMAGTAYLREMFDRYGTIDAMLAAYNAGPGRYDEYLATSRPLPAETRDYVAALAPILAGKPIPEGMVSGPSFPADWREAPLFITRFGAASPVPSRHRSGPRARRGRFGGVRAGETDDAPTQFRKSVGCFSPRSGGTVPVARARPK